MSVVELSTDNEVKTSSIKPVKLLNIDSIKKDISTFTKEITDFNRTICKNNHHY